VSTLDHQNELFSSALAARRAGNDARARALLEELITRYPDSPLVSSARRELAALGQIERP